MITILINWKKVSVYERGEESSCMCVCVCVCERERERVYEACSVTFPTSDISLLKAVSCTDEIFVD